MSAFWKNIEVLRVGCRTRQEDNEFNLELGE